MERLTDEGPYADIIKDIFSGGEYLVHARGDLMAKGAWKDLSNRIKTYFNNDKARNKIIDTFLKEHLKTTERNSKHGLLHGNHGDKLDTLIGTLILQSNLLPQLKVTLAMLKAVLMLKT